MEGHRAHLETDENGGIMAPNFSRGLYVDGE